MTRSLDSLFSEASSANLAILLEHQYWRRHGDFPWVAWVRSKAQYSLGSKGEGHTPAEALNCALNCALSHQPDPQTEVSFTQITFGSHIPSLDTIMPTRPKASITPGAVRRL